MSRRLLVSETGSVTLEERAETEVPQISVRDKVVAYVALTKPRIIELLLITTLPSMIAAAGGMPPLWLIAATLAGGAISAGGANAINCYVDRDIDEVMPRTRRRPLPSHKIAPRNALVFGILLGVFAFFFLWATVNLISALITTAALVFYVVVYTMGLKRTTPQNIVIGGAAGAAPALVGWAAVTGAIELPALALFGIIFYWTPPHFWALAMRYEREYKAAGVPMMPVVYGREETSKHIVLYAIMLLAMSLAFFSVGRMGLVYLSAALLLNGVFIVQAVKLRRDTTVRRAWTLFRFSIYYLGLLFAAVAADVLVRGL